MNILRQILLKFKNDEICLDETEKMILDSTKNIFHRFFINKGSSCNKCELKSNCRSGIVFNQKCDIINIGSWKIK